MNLTDRPLHINVDVYELARDLAFYRISLDGGYPREDIVEEDEHGNVSLTPEGVRLYKIYYANYVELLKSYVE